MPLRRAGKPRIRPRMPATVAACRAPGGGPPAPASLRSPSRPRPRAAPTVRVTACSSGAGSSGCDGRSSPGRSGNSTSATLAINSCRSTRCSSYSTRTRPVRLLARARTPRWPCKCSTTRRARSGSRSRPRTAIRARRRLPGPASARAGGYSASVSGCSAASRSASCTAARRESRVAARGSYTRRMLAVAGLAATRRTPGKRRSRFSMRRGPWPDHRGRWTRSRPGRSCRTQGGTGTATLMRVPCQ
jgi:hypothetical protein